MENNVRVDSDVLITEQTFVPYEHKSVVRFEFENNKIFIGELESVSNQVGGGFMFRVNPRLEFRNGDPRSHNGNPFSPVTRIERKPMDEQPFIVFGLKIISTSKSGNGSSDTLNISFFTIEKQKGIMVISKRKEDLEKFKKLSNS